jgi:hypothetical protein
VNPQYASGTDVPAERTRAELERLVVRHGASGWVYGFDDRLALARVSFILGARQYRFDVPLPARAEFKVRLGNGQYRSEAQVSAKVAAETRRRWRALYIVVKALLTANEDGIVTVEDALLAFTVMPDGTTLREQQPAIGEYLARGEMPQLLPGAPEQRVIALEGRR